MRVQVCVCDSAGSGGYFDLAVFIFSHNTLQQLQPILTSQTHLFSFMKWCQNSMATTLPVALGFLTRKRQETGVPCAHKYTRKHTQPLNCNTDGVRPLCQSQFSLHEGLVLKHSGIGEEDMTKIRQEQLYATYCTHLSIYTCHSWLDFNLSYSVCDPTCPFVATFQGEKRFTLKIVSMLSDC